jgi:pimeloyl-ACP methyl ester carboxylesterase
MRIRTGTFAVFVTAVVFTAFCADTASVAASAPAGDAAGGWPAPGRTATAKSAERMLRHPVTLKTEACPAPFDAATRCGVATVPANWAKPDGRTLGIWYASVPAPNGRPTGVTVPFAGGPGEAISETADRFLALVPALPDRAMLIVDLRGNGRSGRLGCPAIDTLPWMPAGQEQVDAMGRCGQQVGAQRDDYTTVGSVLDVEAIRRALHLPHPSLLGVSYGTWPVQIYATLFPHLVQAAVIDGINPFDLDPWGRTYTDALQRVLRLRCERTGLCDPGQADARVRRVAARLAANPVPFPHSTRLLTEGDFSFMSIFAIQHSFPGYLTAINRALAGDYRPLLALTEALTQPSLIFPPGGGSALFAVVSCNEFSAPFNLRHNFAKRAAEFDRGLAGLPGGAFGWFSKQGWVDSGWLEVNLCLHYPRPRFPSQLRPPYHGPFPDVPVLMLNGDIDLNTPLESATRAKKNWPNSVFLTIKDATHVTLASSQCAVRTAVSFLQNPVLPGPRTCASPPAPN